MNEEEKKKREEKNRKRREKRRREHCLRNEVQEYVPYTREDGTVIMVNKYPSRRLKEYGGTLVRHKFTEEDRKNALEKRREYFANKRTLAEELRMILDEKDVKNRMSTALVTKAINGDVRAFEVVRDTIGEKPKEKVEVEEKTITVTLE